MQAVAVGSNDGYLYLLDIVTGEQLAAVDTGGAIKGAPTVDPWQHQGLGLVWLASHGKQLLGCTSAGKQCLKAVWKVSTVWQLPDRSPSGRRLEM